MFSTRCFCASLAAVGGVLLICGALRHDWYLGLLGAMFLIAAAVGDGRR